MRIDNTAFTMYMKCPRMYYERYEADEILQAVPQTDTNRGPGPTPPEGNALDKHIDVRPESVGEARFVHAARPAAGSGIELAGPKPDRDFGTRFHQLVELRRLRGIQLQHNGPGLSKQSGQSIRIPEYPDWPDPELENEAQATFALYEQRYLPEPLEFLEAERTHTIKIPGTSHELAVKIDGVVRHNDGSIGPLDTKTERPGSQNNTREAWAGRTQASLYLWALQILYPKERVSRLVVDVVTRGGPKRAPLFNRFDDISRPQAALEEAIRNVVWVCEDIQRSRKSGWWRSNMNICKDGWKRCDYYDLHVYGRTPENLRKFQPAERYLDV